MTKPAIWKAIPFLAWPLRGIYQIFGSNQYSSSNGWHLHFDPGQSSMFNDHPKSYGLTLRCITGCSISPNAPTSGTHVASGSQIVWNWNAVSGATGYKWNTINDYASATDMGAVLQKQKRGLLVEQHIQDIFGPTILVGYRHRQL